jgi:hypothetical protein
VPVGRNGIKYGTVGAALSAGAFFLGRKGKGTLVVERTGRGGRGKLRVLFVLKESVRLPRRPYMHPGFEKSRNAARAEFANITKGVKGL